MVPAGWWTGASCPPWANPRDQRPAAPGVSGDLGPCAGAGRRTDPVWTQCGWMPGRTVREAVVVGRWGVDGAAAVDWSGSTVRRWRHVLLTSSGVLAATAAAGALQLALGVAAPPLDALRGTGLHSWDLPAAALFGTVSLPCAATWFLGLVRSRRAGVVAQAAAGAVLAELLVQLPVLGPSWLQPPVAALALVMGAAGRGVATGRS